MAGAWILCGVNPKTGECRYYTGRAGEGWLSVHRDEAFMYGREGAARKAEQHNRYSALHGYHFVAQRA
jgi:hypothetical protein